MSRPLILYRNILREHRRMPDRMRVIGNDYVRLEFKQHKSAEEKHLDMFFVAWDNYLSTLKRQNQDEGFGKDLDSQTKGLLSEEQENKLKSLKEETENAWK